VAYATASGAFAPISSVRSTSTLAMALAIGTVERARSSARTGSPPSFALGTSDEMLWPMAR
jgi:hypothetical protein